MADEMIIPEGWTETTLGAIGRYLNGRAFKTSEWSKTGRPIVRIQDLTGSNQNPNHFEGSVEERYVVRPGDLLISWAATLGAYVWRGPEAVLNQHIFKVESKIDRRFHYHLARKLIAELMRNAHGSGMVHVTKSTFESTRVAIPEQQDVQAAIAQAIDLAEEKRASAMQHLSRARRALDRFRNAALANSYREATDAEGAEGEIPLETLLRESLKNGYSAPPTRHETQFRVLTLTATTTGWFDARHFKYTDETFPEDSPFWLRPGDIVVQRGNTAEVVGVPAIYEGKAGQFLFPDLMIRIRPKPDIDPRFLWYMLLAPKPRNFLRDRATGSAGNMPKINQKILAQVPVPVPPKATRTAIVKKLDAAFALSDRIARRLDTMYRSVDLSSQAILAKAFRGELHVTEGSA